MIFYDLICGVLAGTLLSLLLDQGVFAPTFIAAFMSAITAAEVRSVRLC